MSDPILVEVVRGDTVESVHVVDAAIVDESGGLVRAAGDPDRVAFWRSSLKPVQAAVSMAEGWDPRDDEEIAVACSSHNGEAAHLAVVRRMLAGAGLDEGALRCPPAFPMLPSAAAQVGEPAKIFRDCSGKHAAFLGAAVARSLPLGTYLHLDHPIQRAVAARVAALCGGGMTVGVDGCGAPTFAFPLRRIAAAFGSAIAAESRVAAAMRAHPFLVAGTGRVCTALMEAPSDGLVVKAGAEGLLCFAVPGRGLAGAFKVRDGAARGVAPAAVSVLLALGLVQASPSLAGHAEPPVFGGDVPAGRLVANGLPAPR